MNIDENALIETGFNELQDSQKVFRCVMEAVSTPGKVVQTEVLPLKGVAEDLVPVCSILLTLLDIETTFCVVSDGAGFDEMVSKYVKLNCKAETVPLSDAEFAICRIADIPPLRSLNMGTVFEPELSCSLIVLCEFDKSADPLLMEGPGIETVSELRVKGLSVSFTEEWAEMREGYPAGADIYFVSADGRVAAMPRSVKVKRK